MALQLPSPSPSPVRVVSRHTVKPPSRPHERIPLTSWDVAVLFGKYIRRGLLFAQAPLSSTELVDHLQATLADALAAYYPVAGRFVTEQHHGDDGVVGSSVSIDCAGQGVEIHHAIADGVAVADVTPPDADTPVVVQSLFPLNGAINYDGHGLPFFVVQVTELVDGVFLGFACNHALCDGTSFWNFLNAWEEIARARFAPADAPPAASRPPPLIARWSPHGSAASPVVLPYADLSVLGGKKSPLSLTPMRARMLHFSAECLVALKERARQELLAAGDPAGAAALTRFQALTSLVWRCFTRARRLEPDQQTVCIATADNRGRLRPPLPAEYFGNSISLVSTDAVCASELLSRGHGWAAAAVGRAVAAHTDASIRARAANPVVYTGGSFPPNAVMMGSSPWFDMYGCDFGWGKPLAARGGNGNGRANNMETLVVSLYPGRDGGFDFEVAMLPEHMAALEQDDEFWAAVSPDSKG